jgi:hypothetical protein
MNTGGSCQTCDPGCTDAWAPALLSGNMKQPIHSWQVLRTEGELSTH